MKLTVHAEKDTTVFFDAPCLLTELLRESGCPFSQPCGGSHRCGKCRVRIKGAASRQTEVEKTLLGTAAAGLRLACFTELQGDCEVFLTQTQPKIELEGYRSHFAPSPMGTAFGVAADVGTTTVAVYLYDLKKGQLIESEAFTNPQSIYGADVISRIEAATAGESESLRQLILTGIGNAVITSCARAGISPAQCDTAVVTGNTAMLYLLSGQKTDCLAAAPFAVTERLGCFVEELRYLPELRMRTYLPGIISAFVGADMTCALVAVSALTEGGQTTLLLDIGTNGEMALLHHGRIVCCSAAAGPAFEGAGIEMGCMAAQGAIHKVWPEDGTLRYETLGGGKPHGICGSGLIDAAAALLSLGLLDETGSLQAQKVPEGSLLTEQKEQPAVWLGDSGVLLTQKDIRALQLAKAAIRAGTETLLNACRIGADEVEQVLLAGGFGSYLHVAGAAEIGLLPPELAGKTVAVGNAAGMGAAAMLLSAEALARSVRTAERAETLELSSSAFFMESYINNMGF